MEARSAQAARHAVLAGRHAVVADRDPLVRGAVARLVASLGAESVGQSAGVDDLVCRLRAGQPDLVVVDLQFAGAGIADLLAQIARCAAGARVVVLVVANDDPAAVQALRLGAAAVVSKDLEREGFARALSAVVRGEIVTSRRLAAVLIEHARTLRDDARGLRPVRSALSAREWQVLDLLCDHASTAAVADALSITDETANDHVAAILRKLGVASREDAVAMAWRLRSDALGGAA